MIHPSHINVSVLVNRLLSCYSMLAIHDVIDVIIMCRHSDSDYGTIVLPSIVLLCCKAYLHVSGIATVI